MSFDFTGKRALVTGAGKGIGRDVAVLLAHSGASVVAISRTQDDLDSLKQQVPGITVILADLANEGQLRSAADAAGDIDFLVNNAGISKLAPFLDADIHDFDAVMAVNLRSVFLLSQLIARRMVLRGAGGCIVNVSSQASLAALQDHAVYCASKAGLDHLTRVMALELGPHQIRVNAVNPTVVLTAMGKMAWSDPAKSTPMLAKIPLGRFANEREVSSVIAFLLSDAASMVNGITLPIDGGFLV